VLLVDCRQPAEINYGRRAGHGFDRKVVGHLVQYACVRFLLPTWGAPPEKGGKIYDCLWQKALPLQFFYMQRPSVHSAGWGRGHGQ
jgi:hypothetical protein